MNQKRVLISILLYIIGAGLFLIDLFTSKAFGFLIFLFIFIPTSVFELVKMSFSESQNPKNENRLWRLYIGVLLPVLASIIFILFDWLHNSGEIKRLPDFLVAIDISSIFLCSILVIFICSLFSREPSDYVITMTGIFAIVYICLLSSFVTRIRFHEDGLLIFFYLIVVTKLADSGAYIVGVNLGKQKLAPSISPAKTVEGLFGAIFTGLLVGLVIFFIWRNKFKFEVYEFLIITFFITIAGQLGDLVESMIKRYFKKKDSGNLFPFIGGMLDIIDSILIASPVAFLFFSFFGKK